MQIYDPRDYEVPSDQRAPRGRSPWSVAGWALLVLLALILAYTAFWMPVR